jgi:hypothetical protein
MTRTSRLVGNSHYEAICLLREAALLTIALKPRRRLQISARPAGGTFEARLQTSVESVYHLRSFGGARIPVRILSSHWPGATLSFRGDLCSKVF